MKALRATVNILLDPRVIGPEADAERGQWGGKAAEPAACDFMSETLSSAVRDTVLDWAYVGREPHWREVEVDPETYVEGEAVVSGARYGWGWIEGEDDEEGNAWIQISPLDDEDYLDEEMATIMCRDYERVKREHPEWIAQKEHDAQVIVDALNARHETAGAEGADQPLDVDELYDQLERELAFAEDGTRWKAFLTTLQSQVLAWLDTPDEERFT